jgi:cobalt/nickel transport system permease protein
MHVHLADQFHPGGSWLHRRDPRVKVLICLGFILTASVLPAGSWLALGCLFLAAVAAAWSGGLGATFALRRSLIALPFALAALTLPFTTPGAVVLEWPELGLAISGPGLARAGSVLLRSWLAVQAAILLVASTRFGELLWALESLRVPPLLVSLLSLTYRYVFLLADQALHMLRARAARSGSLAEPRDDRARGLAACSERREQSAQSGPRHDSEPGASSSRRRPGVRWQARVAGGMVGSLFLRSLDRGQRVHAAMLSRGYDGRARLLGPRSLLPADSLTLTLAFAGFGGLLAAALAAR